MPMLSGSSDVPLETYINTLYPLFFSGDFPLTFTHFE